MNYEIPENPIFAEEIRQLEPTDRAHASLFNNILVKLFQNGIFNRKKIQEHETNKKNPHGVTTDQIGAATKDALDLAYQNGNEYTDTKIAALINGAPSTMDTLKEISDAMTANKSVVDALEASIGNKAPKAEFDTHVANKNIHITPEERTKWSTVDAALSTTSTNSVQNKVVKAAIDAQNISFTQSINSVNQSLNDLKTEIVLNVGEFSNGINISVPNLNQFKDFDLCFYYNTYYTQTHVNVAYLRENRTTVAYHIKDSKIVEYAILFVDDSTIKLNISATKCKIYFHK